jgi:threonylcarbamoyladenosine tRNA methylthiotransferase MtaB
VITQDENIVSKKVALHTLGCRLNFSESGTIAKGFSDRGYEVVEFGQPADVVFLNTCTVTDQADSTCRQLIRKAHRSSPEGKIVVAGCYAQMDAERIKEMQGVDLVLGTTEKYKVFDYLNEEGSDVIKTDKTIDFYGAATSSEEGHTRSFLKIQDGCNYICSFCIIPQARGRSRAISVKEALEQALHLKESGFKEIVLTGVNIGEYESSSGERLVDLIRAVATSGIERLRLSSVEPNTMTPELVSVLKDTPAFLDHFHIPLQSGSDEILTKMRRRYLKQDYERVIERVLKAFPEAGIGADIIAGHPGESKSHFEETLSFVRELPLTHFHVFPFSRRKNTLSAKMEDQIPHATKKERVQELLFLGEAKLRMFAQDQSGKVNQVLFERRDKNGLWTGYTTNFVKVRVKSEADLKNKIRNVALKGLAQDNSLHGSLHELF